MEGDKKSLKIAVCEFYKLNKAKGKPYTFKHFKKGGVHRTTIYKWLGKVEATGKIERKPGSGTGKSTALTEATKKKIKRLVNNRTGVSQKKIAHNLNITQQAVSINIKKMGLKYRKRARAPKATPAQKQRQIERLENLCNGSMSWNDDRDVIQDDESYFTLTGAGMPGNQGFYTDNIENCPDDVKFRYDEKFPEKVMIHCSISKKGFSQLYVAPKKTSMDGKLYREQGLKRLIKFIDENYVSRDQVVFWPDLPPCHYTNENLEFLRSNGIAYIEKNENPPSAPQIRPIENYWGMLKMKVYEGNWSAKNKENLIRRIKMKQKEINQDTVIRMFENLKEKVHKANESGLNSLLKI